MFVVLFKEDEDGENFYICGGCCDITQPDEDEGERPQTLLDVALRHEGDLADGRHEPPLCGHCGQPALWPGVDDDMAAALWAVVLFKYAPAFKDAAEQWGV